MIPNDSYFILWLILYRTEEAGSHHKACEHCNKVILNSLKYDLFKSITNGIYLNFAGRTKVDKGKWIL